MQETFTAERARDWKAMQRSNSAVLIVAGTFAAIGLLAMLLMTYFQWRTSRSLAGISTAWDLSRGSGAASDVAALGPGDWRLAPGDPAEQSNLRLLDALEQLDKRIDEFKQAISSGGNGAPAVAPNGGSAATGSEPSQANEHARVSVLLNKANSLMNLENAEAAVASFDEVLALDPNHTEALVKKGAALERLHKLNEAVECYDRAIAVDSSMTTAYLYKGGLYNRLERFKEALQCYEKALHTHDQRRS
jgi:tetratricopeptide (TPR) repeat protein